MKPGSRNTAPVLRTVLMAGAVALVASGCGSSAAKSAAPQTKQSGTNSPTTMAPMASHDKSATKVVSRHDVTKDLNGHQVSGVKAHDVMAEMAPDKPMGPRTRKVLAQQLIAARVAAMKYPTVADAEAAGYHLVGGGFGPGSGSHYIGGFSLSFDPSTPLALVYDGISKTSQMVGLMYYSMGDKAPSGFAGPNDHWHRHSGVCNGSTGVLFPPDSNVTEAQCTKAGGAFMAITGWMVHAWVVPAWESPAGVFSHENPNLRCADGTFKTDTIGRCQGS